MEIPHFLAQHIVPLALDSIAVFINAVPDNHKQDCEPLLVQLLSFPFFCLPKSLHAHSATPVDTRV